jgi:hypothetical protein
LDEENQREIRRNNIFYICKESWEPGHRCMGKGKVHYIEVVSNEENDGDDEGIGEPSHLDATEKEPLQDSTKGLIISTLLGVPKYYTFRVRGIL